MSSKSVAQSVWMHIGREAAQNRDALDDAAHAARSQPRLSTEPSEAAQAQIEKDRRRRQSTFTASRGKLSRALGKIRAQGLRCGIAQRDVALLLPFAAHQNRLVGPMDVFEVEARQLRVANPASIQQLQNRRIARGPG